MTTKATPVTLGPFIGGLNTFSDPSTIEDNELAELVNFDILLDGSLVSRPAIKKITNSSYTSARHLGNFTTSSGRVYLIFSGYEANWPKTFAFEPLTNSIVLISNLFAASSVVTYANKLYMISPVENSNPGGAWNGYTFSPILTMPHGISCTVYKERIFVGTGDGLNPSRVYFSNPAGAEAPSLGVETWTGSDFFDVKNGDGQPIQKIYAYQGVIIVFKTKSTYTFAYESAPTKGQVLGVSATNGLDGPDCMVELDNVLYILSDAKAYSIINFNWERINDKVPFVRNNKYTGFTSQNFSLSIIGRRIVVRYFDTFYVFGSKTRVWSTWNSILTPSMFVKFPIIDPVSGVEVYYSGSYIKSGSSIGDSSAIYLIKDETNATDKESFQTKMATKAFSFSLPFAFKRLMWWGVDLSANSEVIATIHPNVPYNKQIKWSEIRLLSYKWKDRHSYTWASPLSISLNVTDSANISNFDSIRLFVKYRKSIRFRQVQFKLHSTLDGSTYTGPFKIFSMTIFLVHKQTVPKRVN